VVGFGLAGYFREVVVTQRKLIRKREITGDVLFAVLQFDGVRRPLQPRLVIVKRIAPGGDPALPPVLSIHARKRAGNCQLWFS
jgi:hypothetical protein